MRKKTIPILGHETARRRSDRHYQIRIPFRQALEQKLDERLFHVRLRVARHVQRHLVEIDTLPHLLRERGLERGRVGRERRRGAAEGMDHENALGGPVVGGLGTSCHDQANNGAQCIYA